MKTLNLDLFFDGPKGPIIAADPTYSVMVKSSSMDEHGRRFITLDCLTLNELEEEIDRLKAELEAIREKARKKDRAHKLKVERQAAMKDCR